MPAGHYILVVDDDADFRETLQMALEMRGYVVQNASNGLEAIAKVHERLPLLILLDLRMPVMNGRQMLQQLRDSPATAQVPVLIISAFGFEWEAELMGAQGYVPKPCDPVELERRIARLLRPRLVFSQSSA